MTRLAETLMPSDMGKADAAPADRTAIGNHSVGVVGAENTRTTGLNLPGSPLAASVDRAVA